MSADDRSKDPWADFDTSKWYDDPTPEVMARATPPSQLHFGRRTDEPPLEPQTVVWGTSAAAHTPRGAQSAEGASDAASPPHGLPSTDDADERDPWGWACPCDECNGVGIYGTSDERDHKP